MPTKEEFSARIAAGLAKRKAAQKAIKDAERDQSDADWSIIYGYLRERSDGRGKKSMNPSFYQC